MTKTLNGIIVIPHLFGGGAEKIAIQLAEALPTETVQMSICCLKATQPAYRYLEADLQAKGIEVITIMEGNKIGLVCLWRLLKYLRKSKSDFIHTHLFGADILGTIAGRLAGIKIIISTEHNTNHDEGGLKKLAKKITVPWRTMTVAVSKTVLKYAQQQEGVSSEKSTVIYNGVALPALDTVSKGDNAIVVGGIGRLVEQKNFTAFINTFEKLNSSKIIGKIAGDGPQRQKLAQLIKQKDLEERVQLVGWQPDIANFFKSLDMVVITSRWEGHPLMLLEAGSYQLPVIVSRIPSIMEIITEGVDALVYTDEQDLARKIEELSMNPSLRAMLGKNLRKKIEDNFSLSHMIKEYEKLYVRLYENSRS